jgi:hypothetical protein
LHNLSWFAPPVWIEKHCGMASTLAARASGQQYVGISKQLTLAD